MSAVAQLRGAAHPDCASETVMTISGERAGRSWYLGGHGGGQVCGGSLGWGFHAAHRKRPALPIALLGLTLPPPGEKKGAPQRARPPSTELVPHRARNRAQVSQVPKMTFPGHNVQWEETKSTTKDPHYPFKEAGSGRRSVAKQEGNTEQQRHTPAALLQTATDDAHRT